jgi:hypothetical protein
MNVATLDTSQMKRAELVPSLVAAAIKIALKIGVAEQVDSELGTHLTAKFNGFTVIYRTPKAMIFTASTNFGVDIWLGTKCFSVGWNSQTLKDYEIINFKRGPWIPAFLSFAEQLET